MSKIVTINVTQADIDHGERADCSDCPVARAIQRALGSGDYRCGMTTVWQMKDPITEFLSLPKIATDWIDRYDWRIGETPEPFSFELEVPS